MSRLRSSLAMVTRLVFIPEIARLRVRIRCGNAQALVDERNFLQDPAGLHHDFFALHSHSALAKTSYPQNFVRKEDQRELCIVPTLFNR